MTTKNFQAPTDEEIARYAYFLWETEGGIHGRDLDYWLQAEKHLIAARQQDADLINFVSSRENPVMKAPESPAPRNIPVSKSSRRRQNRVAQEAVCA
jgi:hypothetical protein